MAKKTKSGWSLDVFIDGLSDFQAECLMDVIIAFVEACDGSIGGGIVPAADEEE
jgi:hypothetical protein